MTTTSTPIPKQGRLRRWLPFFYTFIGLFLFSLACFSYWYYNDNDLAAVHERAKLLGQPTSWEEINLISASSERLALWERIAVLQTDLPTCRSAVSSAGSTPRPTSISVTIDPWSPLPTELRTHHDRLDKAKVSELVQLLKLLGNERLNLRAQITWETKLDEISIYRWLNDFLCERIALAKEEDIGLWLRLSLAQYQRISSHLLFLNLIKNSMLKTSLKAIAKRTVEIKSYHQAISNDLLAVADQIYLDHLQAWQGDYICAFDAFKKRVSFNKLGLDIEWYLPLATRYGRGELFESHLNIISQLTSLKPGDALRWASAEDAKLYAIRSSWSPTVIVNRKFRPTIAAFFERAVYNDLYCRLLAAEISGKPWPIDILDKSNDPLRPIYENGILIGAYSVGEDGSDDGGSSTTDIVFPLYAKPQPDEIPSADTKRSTEQYSPRP